MLYLPYIQRENFRTKQNKKFNLDLEVESGLLR